MPSGVLSMHFAISCVMASLAMDEAYILSMCGLSCEKLFSSSGRLLGEGFGTAMSCSSSFLSKSPNLRYHPVSFCHPGTRRGSRSLTGTALFLSRLAFSASLRIRSIVGLWC